MKPVGDVNGDGFADIVQPKERHKALLVAGRESTKEAVSGTRPSLVLPKPMAR